MKVFKILSIGVITLLGMTEGKTAEHPDAERFDTVTEKMGNVIRCGEKVVRALADLDDTIKKEGLDSYFKEKFPAPEVYNTHQGIMDFLEVSPQSNLKANIQQFKVFHSHFAILERNKAQDNFIREGEMHTGENPAILQSKVEKRELNAENLTRFSLEIVNFMELTSEYNLCYKNLNYSPEGIEGTIDIKFDTDINRRLDFFQLIRDRLKEMEGYLQQVIKNIRPEIAARNNALIFFEPIYQENHTLSAKALTQLYKKGLFGFVKVVEEKQMEPLASLVSILVPGNNGPAFLKLAEEIKNHIEEYKV